MNLKAIMKKAHELAGELEKDDFSMEKRVKLFTHTDLDGIGCAVIANLAFGKENVDVEYLDYKEVNAVLKSFLEIYDEHEYGMTLITDISPSKEIAELIDDSFANTVLLDHHETALWLNDYQWAHVAVTQGGRKTCGTELLYMYLKQRLSFPDGTDEFVEAVRRRDTWDWKVLGDMRAKELNDLLFILGRERFVERFSENISVEFTDAEAFLLQVEQERNQQYIDQKKQEVIKRKFGAYNIGIVFAEKLVSEIGETVAKENPDIDFAAVVIPPKVVSFRRGEKEINLAEVAKRLGGGGHSAAAGATIPENAVANFLEELFSLCK